MLNAKIVEALCSETDKKANFQFQLRLWPSLAKSLGFPVKKMTNNLSSMQQQIFNNWTRYNLRGGTIIVWEQFS